MFEPALQIRDDERYSATVGSAEFLPSRASAGSTERIRHALPAPAISTSGSPILTTQEAARYLRYRTASGVRTAVSRGLLRPAGIGPRGTLMLTIDELNRFVFERAPSYAAANLGTPGSKDAPNEVPRREDQASRRVSSGRNNLLGASEVHRPAHRQAQGGGEVPARRERARSSARTGQPARRDPPAHASDPARSRWGIREIVDRVQDAQDRPSDRAHVR